MQLSFEQLRFSAAQNTWETILPEISLALLAVILLVLEMVLPRHRQNLIPKVAMIGQGIILALVAGSLEQGSRISFAGLLRHSLEGDIMRLFFLLSSLLASHIGWVFLSRRNLPKVEFFHVLLIATAGLMLLAQSHHFLMLFVALETVTVAFYVLVSYCRESPYSLEAGLKYLVLGAFSSSILLFGVVLLYGVASNPALAGSSADSMNFLDLKAFIAVNPDNPLVIAGALLVIAGIAFKIGTVPFQIWIPDVYQGAPTPVTAFLSVSSKAGAFVLLLNLVSGPFAALETVLIRLLTVVAILTILFGNLAALSQYNLKRLMGLSGISHAGYMLVGVIASFSIPWAGHAVLFYLFAYLFASFAVFGVMALLSPKEDSAQELGNYEQLANSNPFLGTVLIVGIGSLAGIPPLAGFIGKLLIFIAAFQAKLYLLLGVSILGVVISIFYYFRWIVSIAFTRLRTSSPGTDEALPVFPVPTQGYRITMGVLTVISILLGFHQGLLGFLSF